LINSVLSRKMFYGNTTTEKVRSDLSIFMIWLAKLYV